MFPVEAHASLSAEVMARYSTVCHRLQRLASTDRSLAELEITAAWATLRRLHRDHPDQCKSPEQILEKFQQASARRHVPTHVTRVPIAMLRPLGGLSVFESAPVAM